ncbi:hypothetical protein HHK36_026753 [Tetracentron sinense]|uniref:Bifunctional inhibitor/plant lipid transfer protein/seed storage helical domain-containing protein n=1 Tax=Tetracentron sinense TaxID=13715 RepID=A0A834YLA4_TETSI|nr:hypothetical protein HHK36_026753 [Tetracentron sinense]
MEGFKGFGGLIAVSAMVFAISVMSVNGQIITPCTASMITSFTPCFNFITGSSGNGSAPTSDCCGTLKSLVSSSMDCACLIVTGNVPFQLPINRTLAISLPRACKMGGVPLQCKASGTPLPAPGPVSLGPTLPPGSAPSSSPTATSNSESASPDLAPESGTTSALAPVSPSVNAESPPTTTSPGIRPVLTPSAAKPSHTSSPSLLLFVLGSIVFKYF